jgi:hypothetical protein
MNSKQRRTALNAFEDKVFSDASEFTAVLFAPHGQTTRQAFSTFPQAKAAAENLRDEYGRSGMIYANTKAGRSICISRKDWDRYLAMWQEKQT